VQTVTSIAEQSNTAGQMCTVGWSLIPRFSVMRSKP